MSHGKARKEKNCLNCNARVFGRYCHVCGQENVEPKETAWGMVVHFFNDITHFEGKFLTAIRYLLFKPGFLTAEYFRGRRASYMNPVRMYVFSSAFFFIIFFSFFSGNQNMAGVVKIKESTGGLKVSTSKKNKSAREEALKNAETKEDSAIINSILPGDTSGRFKNNDSTKKWANNGLFSRNGKEYKTMAEYDSVQNSLPKEKRDQWFQRMVTRRLIIIVEKYGGDMTKFNKALLDHARQSLPKMLFISLPLFALILSLLYIRRQQFYYVNHLIFTIHLFVFVFLMLLLNFTNNKFLASNGWGTFISVMLWTYMFIYLYKAMRRMYGQGRFKTIVKYLLLLFFALILNSFLFVALFSYSFFNI